MTSGRLPNGLRIVLVRDPRATEIQVTMKYAVGAADDPAGQEGMAHLVEHLMFQQVLGAQTLFAQLESSASFFNATTTFDATTYIARAEPARLEKLLAVEAVRVGFRCTTISESEFVREREVVINEVRDRSYATEVYTALHAALYGASHPYRRATSGSNDSVSAISFKDACAFADRFYTTENAVLVISGDITPEVVEAALGKFLGRVARRPKAPRQGVQSGAGTNEQTVPLPIDDDTFLLSWHLPTDPLLLTQTRTVAKAVVAAIDGEVAGRVEGVVLGDERAPRFGVLVELGDGETRETVLEAAAHAVAELPAMFLRTRFGDIDEIAWNAIRQGAIYELYTNLEEGSARDERLASYVLQGRDAKEALAAEFQALRDMTPDVAAAIVRRHFAFDQMSVLTLQPSQRGSVGKRVGVRAPVHDMGLHRDQPDPAEARQRLDGKAPNVKDMTIRALPNGMTIVLLPVATVPTIDIRLVFGVGSADEPADKRGAALVAAHGLNWDLVYLNDLIAFLQGGGGRRVVVDVDHTTFAAGGVNMYLDVLLAGLRRWVREGTYDEADAVVDGMRQAAKREDDSGVLTDAWRAALYGGQHPYAHAGIARHTSTNLTTDDAEAFRRAHYTPDNATLIVAGNFDVALANQWIDYLFADWRGQRQEVVRPHPSPQPPASVAMVSQASAISLRMAFAATTGSRAHQLVASQMIAEIVSDVRHQLGAAYMVNADLKEQRRTTHYELTAQLDASRATAAAELVRDRLRALRADPDATARAFIAARKRVLVQLRAIGANARDVANRVERDIELARAPLSDLQAEAAVRALTIDDMSTTLADLDPDRAVIMMRGPHAELTAAFGALGRTPRFVRFDQAAVDAREDAPDGSATPEPTRRKRRRITVADLEASLTDAEAAVRGSRLALMVGATWGAGHVIEDNTRIHPDCCSGLGVSAAVGYQLRTTLSAGIRASVSRLKGEYFVDFAMERFPILQTAIDTGVYLEARRSIFWGSVVVGLHVDHITDPNPESRDVVATHLGLGIGALGGVDVVRLGRHRIGVYAQAYGAMITPLSTSTYAIGLAYRQ